MNFIDIKKEIFPNGELVHCIVFDCTSVAPDRIREAIQVFAPRVECFYLVSSGLKNEQMGADTNPYGIVRWIVKKDLSDSTYKPARLMMLNKRVDSQLKNIVKAYKNVGAVLTSEGIFNVNGWKYTNSKTEQSIERRTLYYRLWYKPETFTHLDALVDNALVDINLN